MSGTEEFGKRGARPAPQDYQPLPPAHALSSPLVRQLAGMAVGVAIIFAIGAAATYYMRQFGKSLDGQFVEAARPGDPQAAISRAPASASLRRIHQGCVDRTQTVSLNVNREAYKMDTISIAEEEALLRAGAYTACLAAEQPRRLCAAEHRQHLLTATREYFKRLRRVREEWILRVGTPEVSRKVMISGVITDSDVRSPKDLPSGRVDLRLSEELRALVAKGFIGAGDIGGLAAAGAQREMADALKSITPRPSPCI